MTTVPPDGPGTPDGENEPPPLTEADLEKFLKELDTTPETDEDPQANVIDAGEPGAPRPGGQREMGGAEDGAETERYALIFTPIAQAKDLARLCAAAGIGVVVVPTDTGAIAARAIAAPRRRDEWDISELLGEGSPEPDTDDGEHAQLPGEAAHLASDISALMPFPVVVMVAQLATDVGIEDGLSGHVTALRYERGSAVGTVSPGLLLAQADQIAEDLVLGRVRPTEVPGALHSGDVPPGGKRGFFDRFRRPDPED